MKRSLVGASLLSLVAASATFSGSASALTREEALTKARSYAGHKWRSTVANQTIGPAFRNASPVCTNNWASYKSAFLPGDNVGVAYDWGGWFSLAQFDAQIAAGQGAGSEAAGPIYDGCTTGVDCSGFVSQVWGVGHNTTTSIADSATLAPQIPVANILTGDVFNKRAYHVAMYTHTLPSGEPAFIEAYGYNTNVNTTGGWSHVSGYLPRRYSGMTGSQNVTANPAGTTTNPIVIGAFPYNDTRNTALSPSSVLDSCAAAPATEQRGPEYVYVANITAPGTLTVSVSSGAPTDIDVQVLAGLPSPGACVARNDSNTSVQVGCGSYYVVADTFGADASKAGSYTLNATFTPSGQPCSAVPGPTPFNPKGKAGDKCAFPGNKNLPFCNPNLGGDICIYTSTDSFCSIPCADDSACGALGAGGCCEDLGEGEKYCVTQALCGTGGSSGATASGGEADGGAGTEEPGAVDPNDPDGDGIPGTTKKKIVKDGCNVASGGESGLALAALAGLALVATARRRKRS